MRDIRVSSAFASLAKTPGDWVYYNLGLLTVAGKLPQVAPLASREALAGLEEGAPVASFGFAHEGEKVTRFDKFEPRLSRGKIYVISPARNLPGHPRLLHVKAEIPKNAYGSPLVTARGEILGVYSEAAPGPAAGTNSDGRGLGNLHYVTIVNLDTINLWLQDRNAETWPSAAAAAATIQKTQDAR